MSNTLLINKQKREIKKLREQLESVPDLDGLVSENQKLRQAVVRVGKVAEYALNDYAQTIVHALVGQEILADVVRKMVTRERKAGETLKWFNEVWLKRHEIYDQLEEEHGGEQARIMIREIMGVSNLDEVFADADKFVNQEIGKYVSELNDALDQE